jgi:hypothetical protein
MASHPVHDEPVWREQFHDGTVDDELEWPNPCIELLLGQLGL